MKNLILMSILSAFVFACDNGGGGGKGLLNNKPGAGLPPLTEAQKVKVKTLADSYNEVTDMFDSQSVQPGDYRPFAGRTKARATGQLKQKLEKAINESRCFRDQQESKDPNKYKRELTISGTNCPISYTEEFGYTQSEQGLNAHQSSNYFAKPGMEIYEATDIHEYNFSGTATVTIVGQTETAQTLQTTGSIGGKIKSKSSGEINAGFSESKTITEQYVDGVYSEIGPMEQVVDLTFSDFRAVGVINMQVESPKDATFALNGVDVTREEFEAVFGTLK